MRATPKIQIGQYSSAGRKPTNDDSFGVLVPDGEALLTKGIAMAIADGLSSSAAAKQASETCVKSFLDDYYATPASWAVKRAVGTVLKAVNGWLFAQGQKLAGPGGMASTFSGLVLKAGTAHIFHAGDSRIALVRDGKLEPLTRDHRTRVAPIAHGLARAVGAVPNLEIDYRAEPLEAGDVLVFTTDGVHDHLTVGDFVREVSAQADLESAARTLVEIAYGRGSADNLTCQLVRVDALGASDVAEHQATSRTLPFPPELAPGQTFEGYTILRELHASKRSQVFLVRDAANGETCVLKTPSVNFEDDTAYIEAFAREEWIARLIVSPHSLAMVQTGRPRRHLYTVMEFFDGQTLRQWMLDNPSPPLETVRAIIGQVTKALRAMHRKDIVHGDLKPDNVMIDHAGLVKLIDFGSARAAGVDEAKASAGIGAHRGGGQGEGETGGGGAIDATPPEYLVGDPPSHSGDLFALGALTYELLCGRLPYGRGFAKRQDVERLQYVPLLRLRDDVPVWVDAAIQQAVAKRPSERPRALSELVENLRNPNPSLLRDRPRPLLERDPAHFWRVVALLQLGAILVLLYWLGRG